MQAFSLIANARLPVLLSVPHAGTRYSQALLASARVSASALAMLEDPLVDRLIAGGVEAGAGAIVAHAPRAEIDLNRSLDDLDTSMIGGASIAGVSPPGQPAPAMSRRAAAGLGLIPSRLIGHGALWRRSLAPQEVQRRIDTIHRPYHGAIAAELDRMRQRFGVAVLLDCHSMPPRGGDRPGIVLGDRQGSSAADMVTRGVEAVCAARGYATVRNDPYAGGEIVGRHGDPAAGIHALQIEFDRSLYLAATLRDPGPEFGHVVSLLAAIVRSVAQAAVPSALSLAAE